MSDDDARERILRRRARFAVAALASVGVAASEAAACKSESDEKPYRIKSDDSKPRPQSCLKIGLPPDEQDAEAMPRPCLSEVRRLPPDAAPMPCLSPPPTRPDGGK